MDPKIEMMLEGEEQLVWSGKTNPKILKFSLSFGIIISIIVSSIFFLIPTIDFSSDSGAVTAVPGFLIGGVILIVGLAGTFICYYSMKVKEFALTKKRILIKSGIIGTDFKSVYYDQIQNAIVDVGLIGKIFGTGSVKFDTGDTKMQTTHSKHGSSTRQVKVYHTFYQISEPYKVYKHAQGSLSKRKEDLFAGRT